MSGKGTPWSEIRRRRDPEYEADVARVRAELERTWIRPEEEGFLALWHRPGYASSSLEHMHCGKTFASTLEVEARLIELIPLEQRCPACQGSFAE